MSRIFKYSDAISKASSFKIAINVLVYGWMRFANDKRKQITALAQISQAVYTYAECNAHWIKHITLIS